MMVRQLGALALILASGSACSNDGGGRERLLQQPEAEAGVAAESRPIDLVKAATDPEEMDRICRMTHAEVSRRLGSHRVTTRARIRASAAGREHDLEERGELVVSPKGSFSVTAENQKGRAREVVFVNSLMAHRATGGEWTLEKGDGFEQRFREDTYRMWSVTYRTFRDHIAFSSPQPTEFAGRSAVRYGISLAKPEGEAPAEEMPPPPLTATDQERELARLERLMAKRRGQIKRYLSANGELIVDEATQAPLKFVFDGQTEVIRKGKVPPAASPEPPAARDESAPTGAEAAAAGGEPSPVGAEAGAAGAEAGTPPPGLPPTPPLPGLVTLVTSYHVEVELHEVGEPHVVNLPEASKPPPRRRKIDHQPLEGLATPPPADPGSKAGAATP